MSTVCVQRLQVMTYRGLGGRVSSSPSLDCLATEYNGGVAVDDSSGSLSHQMSKANS